MSETIATCMMCGVSRRLPRGIPVLAAAAAAEGAARALRPRSGLIAPYPVRAASYFSAAELLRARRFRYPQMALGLAASGVELGVLMRWRAGRLRPAAEAAALTAATTAAALPLRAVARRRALRVGLVTQSWPGWGADLAKSTAIGAALGAGAAEAVAAAIRRWPRGWWAPTAGAAGRLARAVVFPRPGGPPPVFHPLHPPPGGGTPPAPAPPARPAGGEGGGGHLLRPGPRAPAA